MKGVKNINKAENEINYSEKCFTEINFRSLHKNRAEFLKILYSKIEK